MVHVFTIPQDYFSLWQSVCHSYSGTSRCHHIMSLIHYLFYVCCKFNTVIAPVHIPGLKNSAAVALSQLQEGQFWELIPHVAALFTPVPLLDLASFKWEQNTNSIGVSHPVLTAPTAPHNANIWCFVTLTASLHFQATKILYFSLSLI